MDQQNVNQQMEQVKKGKRKEKRSRGFGRMLISTIYALVTMALIAIVISHWFPVLRISGTGMEPTLAQGGYAVVMREAEWEPGDVIAFYYNDLMQIKRVIAMPGDYVSVLEDGTVMVNGKKLNERFVANKAYGTGDIDYPYMVPDGRWFVMGDNRATSLDSRNAAYGCVAEEQVIGKVIAQLGFVKGYNLFAE